MEMVSEFFTIVDGDGQDLFLERRQHRDKCIGHGVGSFAVNQLDAGVFSFSFNSGNQSAAMVFADNGIDFPIAEPFFGIHHERTTINADAAGDLAPAVTTAVAFSVLFRRTAQMFIQGSAFFLVGPNVLIDGFMADSRVMGLRQIPGDLLGTPIQLE